MSIKDTIDIAKSFNGSQWAAIVSIIAAGIYGFNWIENRYVQQAELDRLTKEYNQTIKIQQENLEKVLEHTIRVDSKISALITTQYSPTQIEKINKSAQLYEEHMRRYNETKKPK